MVNIGEVSRQAQGFHVIVVRLGRQAGPILNIVISFRDFLSGSFQNPFYSGKRT